MVLSTARDSCQDGVEVGGCKLQTLPKMPEDASKDCAKMSCKAKGEMVAGGVVEEVEEKCR